MTDARMKCDLRRKVLRNNHYNIRSCVLSFGLRGRGSGRKDHRPLLYLYMFENDTLAMLNYGLI